MAEGGAGVPHWPPFRAQLAVAEAAAEAVADAIAEAGQRTSTN